MSEDRRDHGGLRPESVRSIRRGHGGNCSSIGSVVDMLFASSVVGSAVLAAVIVAMKQETVTLVGSPSIPSDSPEPEAERKGAPENETLP